MIMWNAIKVVLESKVSQKESIKTCFDHMQLSKKVGQNATLTYIFTLFSRASMIQNFHQYEQGVCLELFKLMLYLQKKNMCTLIADTVYTSPIIQIACIFHTRITCTYPLHCCWDGNNILDGIPKALNVIVPVQLDLKKRRRINPYMYDVTSLNVIVPVQLDLKKRRKIKSYMYDVT